jgi:hypothetical protein
MGWGRAAVIVGGFLTGATAGASTGASVAPYFLWADPTGTGTVIACAIVGGVGGALGIDVFNKPDGDDDDDD